MYIVNLLNLFTNQKFQKTFDSEYKFRIFRNKCRYSKKVVISSYYKEP